MLSLIRTLTCNLFFQLAASCRSPVRYDLTCHVLWTCLHDFIAVSFYLNMYFLVTVNKISIYILFVCILSVCDNLSVMLITWKWLDWSAFWWKVVMKTCDWHRGWMILIYLINDVWYLSLNFIWLQYILIWRMMKMLVKKLQNSHKSFKKLSLVLWQ